jgi:hypothetical protein
MHNFSGLGKRITSISGNGQIYTKIIKALCLYCLSLSANLAEKEMESQPIADLIADLKGFIINQMSEEGETLNIQLCLDPVNHPAQFVILMASECTNWYCQPISNSSVTINSFIPVCRLQMKILGTVLNSHHVWKIYLQTDSQSGMGVLVLNTKSLKLFDSNLDLLTKEKIVELFAANEYQNE